MWQRGMASIKLRHTRLWPTTSLTAHVRNRQYAPSVPIPRGASHLLTASPADPRQRLNNFLQSNGMVNDLQWIITRHGPAHKPIWHAICLGRSFPWVIRFPYSSPTVKGRELGNGSARKKGKAEDEAARKALRALAPSPPPRIPMLTVRRRNSFP